MFLLKVWPKGLLSLLQVVRRSLFSTQLSPLPFYSESLLMNRLL
jgi:hypothetical protein